MMSFLYLLTFFCPFFYKKELFAVVNDNLNKNSNLINLTMPYNYIITIFMLVLILLIINIQKRKENERKSIKLLKISQAMLEINHNILKMKNINELFDLILEKAMSIIDCSNYGCIFVLKNKTLQIQSCKGYNDEKLINSSIPLKNSIHWTKEQGKIETILIINNIHELDVKFISKHAGKFSKEFKIHSYLSTPILINKKFYGMLNLYSNKKNAFNKEHIEIMEYMKSEIEIAISSHNLYEKIYHLSKFDKLTNLYNINYFEEEFNNYVNKAISLNEQFNLVVFDLNELKKVNDTYGHIIGDLYIKTFTSELSSRMNSSSILARYGGDEFVGIFPNKDIKYLIETFENLSQYFKNNPIKVKNDKITCSFSYGISTFNKDDVLYKNLLKIADKRMYDYKKKSKSNNTKQ